MLFNTFTLVAFLVSVSASPVTPEEQLARIPLGRYDQWVVGGWRAFCDQTQDNYCQYDFEIVGGEIKGPDVHVPGFRATCGAIWQIKKTFYPMKCQIGEETPGISSGNTTRSMNVKLLTPEDNPKGLLQVSYSFAEPGRPPRQAFLSLSVLT
ncbi:hypothetical protein HYALB_00011796 [Hymenoscyphus albidus]|uniref:Uncharacterized protein n=1 Tax=Hymenoscyphus albidus TaxID=595503 RepID=A0A9N9LMW0_9HELO|nr:hypothetical protein HYALB_00011796 [Hymenoscyphus albidus]